MGTFEPMVPEAYRVRKVIRELADTYTLELESASGSPLHYAPGQFNMLYAFGVGEVPISMSGDPSQPHLLTHTLRAVGPVTQAICASGRDSVVGVRGPFGTPWPVEQAFGKDVVIMAGGIGLAPLRPAIYSILQHREKFGKFVLLYGSRAPENILFENELHAWRSRFDTQVNLTVDSASGNWKGNVGVVSTLISSIDLDLKNSLVFLCGPEIMMHFSILELIQRGFSKNQIYLSMERNMKCAIGFCGHCQFGPTFICKEGAVFRFDQIERFFRIKEI